MVMHWNGHSSQHDGCSIEKVAICTMTARSQNHSRIRCWMLFVRTIGAGMTWKNTGDACPKWSIYVSHILDVDLYSDPRLLLAFPTTCFKTCPKNVPPIIVKKMWSAVACCRPQNILWVLDAWMVWTTTLSSSMSIFIHLKSRKNPFDIFWPSNPCQHWKTCDPSMRHLAVQLGDARHHQQGPRLRDLRSCCSWGQMEQPVPMRSSAGGASVWTVLTRILKIPLGQMMRETHIVA